MLCRLPALAFPQMPDLREQKRSHISRNVSVRGRSGGSASSRSMISASLSSAARFVMDAVGPNNASQGTRTAGLFQRIQPYPGDVRHQPGETKPFGTNCLLARRLVERGVRFVQLYHSSWNDHTDLNVNLKRNCDGPTHRCVTHGSETARAPRFHSGHLGRRIWTHTD